MVRTDHGTWHARTVVVAARRLHRRRRARRGAAVPAGIAALTAGRLPQPAELPDGGVLVVGASASGVQIADELHRSGRPVTLAVGEHVRMPRTYRGRDILWWMDAPGLLDERYDEVDDLSGPATCRRRNWSARPTRTLDLNALRGAGVRLVGRLAGVRDGVAQFSGSLPNVCTLADLKLGRLLDTHRRVGRPRRLDGVEPPQRFDADTRARTRPLSTRPAAAARSARSCGPPASGRTSPGSTSRCSTARAGSVHDGGVTAAPGLYLLGLPFLRRRKSSLIDGAAADAAELADISPPTSTPGPGDRPSTRSTAAS